MLRLVPATLSMSRRLVVAGVLVAVPLIIFGLREISSSQNERWVLFHGNVESVRALLDRGAEVNARGEAGRTPLHAAVARGDADLVNLLLDRGAEVNARNDYNEAPVYQAASRLDVEVAKLLLANGADPNIPANGMDTAMDAVYTLHGTQNSEEMLDLLKSYGGTSQYDE